MASSPYDIRIAMVFLQRPLEDNMIKL